MSFLRGGQMLSIHLSPEHILFYAWLKTYWIASSDFSVYVHFVNQNKLVTADQRNTDK